MSKLASFIQATRLKQMAIVFLAGVMLLFTTACNGAAQATMPTSQGQTVMAVRIQPIRCSPTKVV